MGLCWSFQLDDAENIATLSGSGDLVPSGGKRPSSKRDSVLASNKRNSVLTVKEENLRPDVVSDTTSITVSEEDVIEHEEDEVTRSTDRSNVSSESMDVIQPRSTGRSSESVMKEESPKPKRSAASRAVNVHDRYEYIRKLEDTHFGQVWEGYDKVEKKRVAVKQSMKANVIEKRHSRTNEDIPEDVLEEIAIHKALMSDRDCPKTVIGLNNVHETRENIYMVMEFGDGGSLFDHLHTATMPVHSCSSDELYNHYIGWKQDVRRWFIDLASAVNYMHKRNICHKDISLQNVLLTRKEHGLDVRIVDFGLAERWRESEYDRRCITNAKVGKSNFASPECFDPDVASFDAKANDVWCLGVLLFMCLTKCSPFRNPLDANSKELQRGPRGIIRLLRRWRRDHLMDNMELDLLSRIFRDEDSRIRIDRLMKHPYVSGSKSAVKTQSRGFAQSKTQMQKAEYVPYKTTTDVWKEKRASGEQRQTKTQTRTRGSSRYSHDDRAVQTRVG